MWRVHRLDQINAKKPANLLDSMSLALRFRSKQIGRFFYVTRQVEVTGTLRDQSMPGSNWLKADTTASLCSRLDSSSWPAHRDSPPNRLGVGREWRHSESVHA